MESRAPSASKPPRTIPALTGVRALAALSVAIYHFARFPGSDRLSLFLEGVRREMYVGVTVFFVLSGFLIAYRYLPGAALDRAWYARYFRNRFARIYPVYLLVTLVALLAAGTTDPLGWTLNLTLLKGYFDDYRFSAVGAAWTLTVEETFYLLAPLAFLLLRSPGRRLRLERYGALLALVYASGFAALSLGQAVHWHGFCASFRELYLHTIFGRVFEFVAGICLAQAMLQGKRLRLPGPLAGRATLVGSLGVAACVVAEALLHIPTQAEPYLTWADAALFTFALPIFVAIAFEGLARERTWFGRMLSSRLMQALGRSSYVFYLIHRGPIADWLEIHVAGPDLTTRILVLSAVSYGVFRLYEEPLRRLISGAGEGAVTDSRPSVRRPARRRPRTGGLRPRRVAGRAA